MSSFLTLPREIRNIIYSHMLVIEHPVEFLPNPFVLPRDKAQAEAIRWPYQVARDFQMKRLQHIKDRFNILLCNRTIHEEAVSLLYRNVFRFTNSIGWFGLDCFLRMIGPSNVQRLRYVEVSHPQCNQVPDSRQQDNFLWEAMPFSRPAAYTMQWWKSPWPSPRLSLREVKLRSFRTIYLGSTSEFDCPINFEYYHDVNLIHTLVSDFGYGSEALFGPYHSNSKQLAKAAAPEIALELFRKTQDNNTFWNVVTIDDHGCFEVYAEGPAVKTDRRPDQNNDQETHIVTTRVPRPTQHRFHYVI